MLRIMVCFRISANFVRISSSTVCFSSKEALLIFFISISWPIIQTLIALLAYQCKSKGCVWLHLPRRLGWWLRSQSCGWVVRGSVLSLGILSLWSTEKFWRRSSCLIDKGRCPGSMAVKKLQSFLLRGTRMFLEPSLMQKEHWLWPRGFLFPERFCKVPRSYST